METAEKPQPTLASAILVICDDQPLATTLAVSLASHGIAVRWAATEVQGLQLLPDGNFDLLVCDEKTVHLVQARSVPTIFLATEDSAIQRFSDSTFNGSIADIITKPVRVAELIWRI